MSGDLIPMLAGLAGIAVIVAVGRVALAPANRLGLGVFRPYRGDPWPVGVQEDDDARFAWTRPTGPAPADPVEEDSLAHVAFRPPRPEPGVPGFEEIGAAGVDVQALTSVGVHRVRH